MEVTFEMAKSCVVEAKIQRSGRPYLGEAQISVQIDTGEGVQRAIVAFQRAPYVVAGLIPGTYAHSNFKPFYQPDARPVEFTIEKRAAAVTFDEN